ncbi:DUF805 domain-containing protein [Latilactobacillus sakei]|uniref:DUF805 domain-containing protein n=1 Tax=Latilactobacillus sakei TaxID=1599 RepID=UPI000C1273AA|nr:DUF805 domain-containing protein [Latilactobacillus sakei]MCM1598009.1 DUF805 domain-containing protein [Latilactobacillus sakei]SON69842.1 conserved membrane protein of unknown function [Latilactobacillus sakei]
MREIQEVPGKVTIKTAFRDYFKGYFDFMGRGTRAGYWWVMGIIIVILYIPLFILLGQLLITKGQVAGINPWIYLGIFAIIAVGIFIPTLALSIRRYRDAGLNGRGAVTLWVLTGWHPVIANNRAVGPSFRPLLAWHY